MRFFKIFGIALLLLLAVSGGAAFRLKEVLLPKDPLDLGQSLAVGSDDAQPERDEGPYIDPVLGTVNVLVVGLDNVDGGSRTDAIALAIFDADNKAVRVASIPRDSRVQIPGRGWDKINHAYVYGGIDLLKETVVNLTGMAVNYFVMVNYKSFPRIIDLIGGIDIYVDKPLKYTDYSGKLFIDISKGQQHMDGRTALGYVRFRHDPLGDIGRVQRQQKLMDIVLSRLKSPAILPRIPALIDEVVAAVDTDLTPLEALKLMQFANALPPDRVQMFMAPGKAGYSGNLSYWILDTVGLSLQLAAKLPPQGQRDVLSSDAGKVSDDAAPAAAPLTEERLRELRERIGKIGILNGDGASGLGRRASRLFQRIGIEVPYAGNARHFDYHSTNIIYPAGGKEASRDAALALAELCGITNAGLVREDRRATLVSIIFGHDKDTVFRRLESLNF